MGCTVCGHEALVETEYRAGGVVARALECARCHAITLDERTARSPHDLDSVRQAMAARQSAGSPYDSGAHCAAPGHVTLRPVETALNELEVLIAEARSTVDVLAQTTQGIPRDAAKDVQRTLRRIAALIGDLAKQRTRTASDVAPVPDARWSSQN
jgi:hypothetical protein